MSEKYTIAQHEKRLHWLKDCPVLLQSYALTKNNTNNSIFLQCKFENIADNAIKAMNIAVKCSDVSHQELENVDNFPYLDINVQPYVLFGDKTPVALPNNTTRNVCIIPLKVIFSDDTTWVNTSEREYELAEYEQQPISSLGKLADQYKRDLHNICADSEKHNYLPTNTNGFTICGCGHVVRQGVTSCPQCGVVFDKLLTVNNQSQLETNNKQYVIKESNIKIASNRKKKIFFRGGITVLACCIIIGIVLGMQATSTRRLREKAEKHISAGYNDTIGISADGSLMQTTLPFYDYHYNAEELSGSFQQVSAFESYWIALRDDGTTIDDIDWNKLREDERKSTPSKGIPFYEFPYYIPQQKDEWNNIQQVAAGSNCYIGLTTTGRVVAYGVNSDGQCDVSDWKDIKQVAVGINYTAGLKKDGTCVLTGDTGNMDVSSWKHIKKICAGYWHIVGLQADGTVVVTGKSNTQFGELDVGNWNNIVDIAAGNNFTIGLQKNGTVVAIGRNTEGQCNVSQWTDIVAVAAGDAHTVGVKKDGTVITVGDNEFGQCKVENWELW